MAVGKTTTCLNRHILRFTLLEDFIKITLFWEKLSMLKNEQKFGISTAQPIICYIFIVEKLLSTACN